MPIEHIFPVRGHSYNQCDRNFGRYGILLKSLATIESAEQYLKVMSSARSNPSPFNEATASNRFIEDWNKGLQVFLSMAATATGSNKVWFAIQQYVKVYFNPEGVITMSRFYASPDLNFTFKKNVLPVSKNDLNLKQVETPGVKDVKIRDVLSLTPFMKPENAEWLKQVLTFQAGVEDQAGPSRRLLQQIRKIPFSLVNILMNLIKNMKVRKND
ncbi:unnamed protein product [Colias eurytheme]|nr:unnamed protein product [Colias eurytheme]